MDYGSIEKTSMANDNSAYFRVHGSLKRSLIGTVLIGWMGLATSVLLTNTRNYLKDDDRMSLLNNTLASSFLVAAPNVAGSLLRIPYAMLLVNHSSRYLHLSAMLISLFGTVCLAILAFTTTNLVQLNSMIYSFYFISGIIGGVGVSVFSIGITTCAFWAPQNKQGLVNGIYGGLTNLGPGIMSLWVSQAIMATSLGITYVIWIGILILIIVVSIPLIYDSPYHQILFGMKDKEFTELDYEQIRNHCTTTHNQVLFPMKKFSETLKQSARSFRTWALVYLYNVSFGGFLALTVYLPSFFHDGYDVTTATAGYYGSMFTIIAACTRVPAGFISDKITFINGGIFIEYVAFTLVIIGSIMTVVFESFQVNLSATVIIALGIGTANAATYKILPKFCINTIEGSSGWVSGIGAFGGVIWPLIMGAIESNNIHLVFILFIVISVIGIVITVIIQIVMNLDEKRNSVDIVRIEIDNAVRQRQ